MISKAPSNATSNAPVLAFDIGGTKILAAVVAPNGKILESTRAPAVLDHGPLEFLEQIGKIGDALLADPAIGREITTIGIASAGPLDPTRGDWLDPTNMKTQGKGWGVVPVTEPLSRRWGRKVVLDNDAAAGALAEQWLGEVACENFVVLTLGTGVGVGVIANGQLVRSGRGLHPEASHLILNPDDKTAVCGCGNLGCAEAYLSGTGFSRRLNAQTGHAYDAREWVKQAKAGDSVALSAFQDYAKWLAVFAHSLCVLYAPEKIVFTGSFAEAGDFFLEPAHERLKSRLTDRRKGQDYLPEFVMSRLGNTACLLGGARLALLQ